jgi:hypothetical protein
LQGAVEEDRGAFWRLRGADCYRPDPPSFSGRKEGRDGAPPIDLVDEDQLCDLLREYRLGLTVEKVESEQNTQFSRIGTPTCRKALHPIYWSSLEPLEPPGTIRPRCSEKRDAYAREGREVKYTDEQLEGIKRATKPDRTMPGHSSLPRTVKGWLGLVGLALLWMVL